MKAGWCQVAGNRTKIFDVVEVSQGFEILLPGRHKGILTCHDKSMTKIYGAVQERGGAMSLLRSSCRVCSFLASFVRPIPLTVISIQTSRSRMELLQAFKDLSYPYDIGPGVYDIHSPRVPPVAEMVELLHRATEVIPVERLRVNPDCGLKTRAW